VHNIPEGIAVGLPLRLSGMSVARVLILSFMTGMPTAAGALIGTAVGAISREMIALCISFAGGAMLYISLKELIPAAGSKQRFFYSMLGLCLGFIMTRLV
jgi:ZIP family zinc transporter